MFGYANLYLGPWVGYSGDWSGYGSYPGLAAIADRVYRGGLGAAFANVPFGRDYYGWLVGVLYLLSGNNVMVPVTLNILVSLSIVCTTYIMAHELWGSKRIARLAALMVAFFPTIIVYAATPNRDPLVTLGIVYGVSRLSLWIGSRKAKDIALGAIGAVLAGIMHTAVIIVFLLVVLVVVGWELGRRILSARINARDIVGLALAVGLVLVVATEADVLLTKVEGDPLKLFSLSTFQSATIKGDLNERTAYLSLDDVIIDSFFDLLAALPKRVALFLYTPFPWMVETAEDVVGLLVAMFFGLGTLVIAAQFRKVLRHARARTLLVFTLLFILAFSWGTVSYGSATRHGTKVVPIVAILVATAAPRIKVPRSSLEVSVR